MPDGSAGLTHSVPLFEGAGSRRHQDRSLTELREDARAYAGSDAAPDLATVQTLVQFAGFPRSGHSLVGSVIDAHPDAVVAHELDLMGLVDHGFDLTELASLICVNSAEFERHGRSWNGYSYRVATGTGGPAPRPLVLGDKKADWAVRRVHEHPSLLTRLRTVAGTVRTAWVVVVRNPYDNVATMSLRRGRRYDRIRIAAETPEQFRRRLARAQGQQVPDTVLPEMVEDYAALCAGVAHLKGAVPADDWLELRHEDLVAQPQPQLRRLFDFLGLVVAPGFVEAAATTVSAEVNQSRHQIHWSPDARDRVRQLAAEHSFLEGYEFDDR